ncbi:monovalent cation/H(+) antiporter subunit G [Aliidiomarina maris]|uniref:Multisubunit sodium/proton antiporter MrpG subunit n=1 Tax=Aliidiomarina maris TaxID=531312 RepID=A0A327X283_9GAMM|nr:monovalent cation/H(+) antiporter subunit G [Aliidiomarina maris]MCL5051366.1 monovalent cation/H(+) antiporter subunit G [Bacillota bacterium]RAJ98414.1 multisubunit sodium/proton antiporter MrpG subunit [Aliidiomarina maris]RUO24771.1 Na+/H+ antiporter subunit G [Aliidiomarina maris]
MTEIIISIFMLTSAGFVLLAAVGILRLPDLYTRMHASTKAGALGIMLMMVAVSAHFMSLTVLAKAIAIILFIFMTAPVAAHAIGRAGYFVGVPVWAKTVKDELYDNYDPDSHRLRSGLETKEELKNLPQKGKPRIRLNTKK